MIIVKYTLTKQGKIPSYIIDGGYFSKKNDKKSPQDYDMIGVSNGNNGIMKFISKSELKDYLDGFSEDWIDYDESPINTIKESNKIWKKKE